MSGGTLPKPPGEKINRKKSPITTFKLPASGRQGAPPRCPYKLGPAGRAWWRMAWKTPQACAWNEGHHYVVARRAMLEDVLQEVSVDKLAAIDLRMTVLDDALGLTPRAMAALHWLVVDDDGNPALTATEAAASELDLKRRAKGLNLGAVAGP